MLRNKNFHLALQIIFCYFLLVNLTSCAPDERPSTDAELLKFDLKATNASEEKVNHFYGATRPFGKGVVRSVVTLDRNENPAAIGVIFSEKALLFPGTEDINITLDLHPKARDMVVDHIDFGYHPHGHAGPGFGVEHFDFHFYWITEEEKLNIPFIFDNGPAADLPPSQYWPDGYVYDPVTVPEMGRHWITEEQAASNDFDETFIYGSYNSQFTFYEPMITMEYLKAGNFESSYPITSLGGYAIPGYYANSYEINFDPVKKQYSVMLTNMSWKE